MSAFLVQNGKQAFSDANGRPLIGGKVYFYAPGTDTLKDTWQDAAQTVLNTNPVILDARGEASIYGGFSYRQVLRDSAGNLIWDQFIPYPNAEFTQFVTDLSNSTDLSKGVSFVGGAPRVVDSVAKVRQMPKTGAKSVDVISYYVGGPKIKSAYDLDASDTTTADDGVLTLVASDGGRWKLRHDGYLTFEQCGGICDAVITPLGVTSGTNDLPNWNRALALKNVCLSFSNPSLTHGEISIQNDNTRLIGVSSNAIIIAEATKSFEYTLSAVGRTGLHLEGFTVDSNKAGRESILTVRTVSVSLVNCTDCQLTKVRGTNAIGYGGIPGIGISTAGGGLRVNTTNCTAMDCGVSGKAADGFFCSSSHSVNTGNVSINCLDTGHVLESCSYSGIVGAVSIGCGAAGAITNAIVSDTYGNYIHGITAQDWKAVNTGGIQIGVFSSGNLIESEVLGVKMVGVSNFIGPGISVRRTGTGRVDGLTIQGSVRNGNAQGILVTSAKRVNISARITGPALSCIQFDGDCTDCVVESGSNLFGGNFGVYASGTSQVLVNGVHAQSQTSYGIYAADTSVVTSLMNDIVNPGGSRYEGKDAGATLNRMTLINGLLSLNSVTAGAPLTGVFSSKATLVNALGSTAGVVGLSAT